MELNNLRLKLSFFQFINHLLKLQQIGPEVLRCNHKLTSPVCVTFTFPAADLLERIQTYEIYGVLLPAGSVARALTAADTLDILGTFLQSTYTF
jgi:hypothetical protein